MMFMENTFVLMWLICVK